MNKRTSFTLLLFIFLVKTYMYSDEFFLADVPADYIGTYVPIQYDNLLKTTRSHYEAMLANKNQYHDILLLQSGKCYSDVNFHDGYAVPLSEFKDFRFASNTRGMFIPDNNGNSYKKISGNTGAQGYKDFDAYVISVIFEDAVYMNNITLRGNLILIDSVEYSVILDSVFFQTDEVSLWLHSEGKKYALVIDGISAKIHESKDEGRQCVLTENYITKFPLFYWDDASYPYINVNKFPSEQLRYLRNLIYAKHGYIFASDDASENL